VNIVIDKALPPPVLRVEARVQFKGAPVSGVVPAKDAGITLGLRAKQITAGPFPMLILDAMGVPLDASLETLVGRVDIPGQYGALVEPINAASGLNYTWTALIDNVNRIPVVGGADHNRPPGSEGVAELRAIVVPVEDCQLGIIFRAESAGTAVTIRRKSTLHVFDISEIMPATVDPAGKAFLPAPANEPEIVKRKASQLVGAVSVAEDPELRFDALQDVTYWVEATLYFTTPDPDIGVIVGLFAPECKRFTGKVEIPSNELLQPQSNVRGADLRHPGDYFYTISRDVNPGVVTLRAVVTPKISGEVGILFGSSTVIGGFIGAILLPHSSLIAGDDVDSL
jgi:hypothetical protein